MKGQSLYGDKNMIPCPSTYVYSLFRCTRTNILFQPISVQTLPYGAIKAQCPYCWAASNNGTRFASAYTWHIYKNPDHPSVKLDLVIAELESRPSFWRRIVLRLRKRRLERGLPAFGRRAGR